MSLQQSTPQQVADLVAGAHGVQVLDVREPWEWALGRIDGSVHIPMREIPARIAELDPARPVVCVCHHGVRSMHVANFLAHQGFESVINLTGGIDAWSRQVDPSVPLY